MPIAEDIRSPAGSGAMPAVPLARSLAFSAVAVGLLFALSGLVPNVWVRMAAFYALTIPPALLGLRLDWQGLLRPTWRLLAIGLAAAVVLYGLMGAGYAGLRWAVPAVGTQVDALYAWRSLVPTGVAMALTTFLIIPGEEIVWRGAVTLPLAARLGPWMGSILGALIFAAAHLRFGSPVLLLAAVVCGLFWSGLTLATRSLVPALVCHLLWDLTVLFWLPY